MKEKGNTGEARKIYTGDWPKQKKKATSKVEWFCDYIWN
jgi:hypothetical protein